MLDHFRATAILNTDMHACVCVCVCVSVWVGGDGGGGVDVGGGRVSV